jgi:2-polyprenyl-3-methyl-5-hydroxy-6-metoxy-1,4-benzoquinol methylase
LSADGSASPSSAPTVAAQSLKREKVTGVGQAASVHRPPRARVVDRTAFVSDYVRDKDVVDIGFVDQSRMVAKQALGTWLHAQVAASAASAVGIDADEDGVRLARELGYAAHASDCQSASAIAGLQLELADVVLAGELLEHLDQPGRFLEAAKILLKPGGKLLITTPNGPSLTNFLSSLMYRELVNPDHVAWYSWHTVQTLLQRHGWRIVDLAYYGFPSVPASSAASRAERSRTRAFNTYQRLARPLFRFRPTLADGLIVVAEPFPQPLG